MSGGGEVRRNGAGKVVGGEVEKAESGREGGGEESRKEVACGGEDSER